jgi:HAD superfamily hydrolase (TIGR01490 family)
MSRPFAVFDIDGTVIRWQLYHAIGDELAKEGKIDPGAFDNVRRARMSWKKRTESFQQYERELVKVFDNSLTNLRSSDFLKAADKVFERYKEQTYTYTRDLIKELKSQNYLLFAISGSPAEIVAKFADFYGFSDFAGTNFKTKDGYFTGVKELSIGKKPELLQKLIDKHGADLGGSLAVGDSEGDVGMLEMVERPIAFNPSKQLFSEAKTKGWKVVIERKNVVYELGPDNGSYILAKTNT